MEKARMERGGPGGHIRRKAEGKPILEFEEDERSGCADPAGK